MEVLKMAMEEGDEGQKGEEVELCLELSIGGRYGASRSDFSCSFGETKGQQIRSRFGDKKMREREGFGEELVRKRRRNLGNEAARGLNLSLNPGQGERLYPEVHTATAGDEESGLASHRSSEASRNGKTASCGSLERSSSAASDYQSATRRGGSSSDTGSHSSHSCSRQVVRCVSGTPAPDHLQCNTSSPQTVDDHPCPTVGLPTQPTVPTILKPSQSNAVERSNNTHPASSNKLPSKETSSSPVIRPPKPPNSNLSDARRMPCVTTTGNGPNGKTIAGFLYKYTNAEVVIMCICHGGFFTPAGFVEHAGGIDVSHPLRHITVVPSRIGS